MTITPITETAAMRSQRRLGAEPRQQATTAATVTAILPTPRGIISRPTRWEWDANQAWKSLGERLFQKLTKETSPACRRPASPEQGTSRSRGSRRRLSGLPNHDRCAAFGSLPSLRIQKTDPYRPVRRRRDMAFRCNRLFYERACQEQASTVDHTPSFTKGGKQHCHFDRGNDIW